MPLSIPDPLPATVTDLIAIWAPLKAEITRLEDAAKPVAAAIVDALFAAGLTEHHDPVYGKIALQNKTTRTVDAALLVALGVDADLVTRATKVSTSAPFLRRYPLKVDGE